MTALFFVVPTAHAQQGPQNEGQLVANDDDAELLDDGDLYDQYAATAARPLEPQDPLNEIHAGRNADVIDRRDGERFTAPLADPLQEIPREFRDQRFDQLLARQTGVPGQLQTGDDNWRRRDDTAFDPSGIPAGSFVFYPELYAGLITSNNLFATRQNQKSDTASQVTPSFRLRSDWNNHELEFFGTLTRTNWRKFDSENTTEFETRVRGRFDIASRTSIAGGIRHEQNMEGRGSTELPDAAAMPAVTTETEIFGQIDHRFNRLGFRLRGQSIDNRFEDVALNSGAIANNHVRNYQEHLLDLRTSYEFSPRLSLFADTALGERVFDNRLDAGGFLQGSKSWLAAVGTRIEFTSNLSLLGRIGYARANPDEARYVNLEGVIYDASLIWTPSLLTTLRLDGSTELEETTQTGSPGYIDRTLSLELVNSWTHRLTTTLGAEYELRDYAGIDQLDKELTLGVGVEYLFGRSWVLGAGYEHTLITGANAYREDTFNLGLRWRR